MWIRLLEATNEGFRPIAAIKVASTTRQETSQEPSPLTKCLLNNGGEYIRSATFVRKLDKSSPWGLLASMVHFSRLVSVMLKLNTE